MGLARGAKEKKQRQAQQEAYARQQAEREKIAREQQIAETERLKKQESAQEEFETGTVLEIQKSLMRMDFDPGDINGQMHPLLKTRSGYMNKNMACWKPADRRRNSETYAAKWWLRIPEYLRISIEKIKN